MGQPIGLALNRRKRKALHLIELILLELDDLDTATYLSYLKWRDTLCRLSSPKLEIIYKEC